MLNRAQHQQFRRAGFVHLRQAFEPAQAEAMGNRIWSYLEEHRGVRRDQPSTWSIEGPWVGLKELKDEPLFHGVGSPAVCAAVDDLLGDGRWRRPPSWGGFLVSVPNCRPAEWSLPAAGWHMDFHLTFTPGTAFGVGVFSFLSRVEEKGGGTLVVQGSHTLVERFVAELPAEQQGERYSVLRDRFNASRPWLAELTGGGALAGRNRRFLEEPHDIDGVPVQVVQLCGEPGDVVLTHPWLLHVTSPNAGPRPRFMRVRLIHAEAGSGRARPEQVGENGTV